MTPEFKTRDTLTRWRCRSACIEAANRMLRALSLAAIFTVVLAQTLVGQERYIATYSGISGSQGPQWVTVDLPLFEKYGLKVEWVLMSGGVRGIQALLSGSSEFFTGDPVGAISVALQKGDIAVVAALLDAIPGGILARKEIRRPADLRGKKIGISNFGGSNELSVILSLRKWNLPKEFVSLVQSGGPSERLSGLMRGALDATPLPPPQSFAASAMGLNLLIDFKDIEAFPQRVLAVRRSFLRNNRGSVKRFIQAYSEGIYRFNNNRELGLATYAKWQKEQTSKINEQTYDYFRGMLSFPPRATRGEGLRIGLQMIAERLGRGKTDVTFDQFLDESVTDELEKEGFFRKLGRN